MMTFLQLTLASYLLKQLKHDSDSRLFTSALELLTRKHAAPWYTLFNKNQAA